MGTKYQNLLDEAITERGAKCADPEIDKSVWWDDPHPQAPARVAIEACEGCPVIAECKEWARNTPSYVGIAGGFYWRSTRSEKWLDMEGNPTWNTPMSDLDGTVTPNKKED